MSEAELPRRPRRGHGRPTLQDVARAAEVTEITVSRFLREPERVAPATAARIEAAIAQTGYVRNLQAGNLASGHSRMVAALIPNVGHSIFAETIQGLSEGLRGSGYELLLASTDYSSEREEEQLNALMGWAPGALIVTGRHHGAGALRLLRRAQAAGTPVIEIWDYAAPDEGDPGFAQVGFNHAAVGRAMARHLVDAGHRVLAYADSAVAEDFRAHERGQGFAAQAQADGAAVHLLRAGAGDVFDAGRRLLDELLAIGPAPVTGVALANDHLACGLLLEAHARGVAVPGRLAMVGFGDFPLGRQMRPALTTVRPPRAEIGRATAAALLRAITGSVAVQGRELPWTLIARESTAGPGAGAA